MSKVRYVFAIVCAIAAFVLCLIAGFGEGIENVLIGYLAAAVVAELFWGHSFAWKIAFFLLKFIVTVFLFWGGILFSGVLFFIIALLVAAPVFGFMASILGAAITVLLMLSAVLFPIHIFTRWGDTE